MRLPVASAIWMANSATSVFPAPVGADTMTDCPASIARIASSWKSSSGNGYRARNCSSSSIIGHSTTGGRLGPRWPAAGLYSGGRAMIVFHVALTAAEDYLTRREAFWRSHIERAQGLRAGSILIRSEEHTSELQSHHDLVCRLLLAKKKNPTTGGAICP